LGTFVGLSSPHISKTTNFIFSQNSPPSNQAMPWCTDNLAMCKPLRTQNFRAPRISWYSFGDICRPFQPSHLKNHIFTQNSPQAIWQCHYAPTNLAKWQTLRTQNFHAPRFSWYSFGDICRPFQPSHLKNHEFHFFTKLPNKPFSYAAVHRPTWPSAKPSELKTFVHQDFHGIHLRTFVGLSNPHISKITNFSFLTKLPTKPSSYAVVHRRPWPCSKPFELKTFVHQEFYGTHLGTFVGLSNPHISKTTNFIYFKKLPNKPSSYVVVHHQPWPCAKPSELKTFVHQEFNGIHLGTFVGLSNPHTSKTTNFIFSKNSPPTNQVMPWCTDKLAMCKPLGTQNFHAPRI